MKRKCVFIIALLMMTAFVVAACSNVNQAILDNVSEIHHGVYEGTSDKATLKVVTGVREKVYNMDGKSGAKSDFCTIILTPKEGFDVAEGAKYGYNFSFEGKTHEGQFEVEKSTGKPTAMLDINIGSIPDFVITVTAGETSTEVTVQGKMTEGMISYSAALDLAKQEFKNEIEALYQNGNLNCEIYIRFVNSMGAAESDYFWYVAFLQPDKTFFGVVIDPLTSSIMAKKNS